MLFRIFSILIGEADTFSVTLDDAQIVDDLKEAIKTKRQLFDAPDLVLYLINVTGSNHQERIEAVKHKSQNLSILQRLDSLDLLTDVFADGAPLRTIHVLVRTIVRVPKGESIHLRACIFVLLPRR